MLIYRLEHKDSKLGIWWHENGDDHKSTEAFQDIECRCNYRNTHPNISDDFGHDVYVDFLEDGWKCAVYSIDHFFAWFGFDWIELQEFGFQAVEININEEDVIVGRAQVIFDPSKINIRRVVSESEYRNYFEKRS